MVTRTATKVAIISSRSRSRCRIKFRRDQHELCVTSRCGHRALRAPWEGQCDVGNLPALSQAYIGQPTAKLATTAVNVSSEAQKVHVLPVLAGKSDGAALFAAYLSILCRPLTSPFFAAAPRAARPPLYSPIGASSGDLDDLANSLLDQQSNKSMVSSLS